MKLCVLKKELGLSSRGRPKKELSFTLSFRLDKEMATQFVQLAAQEGMSESLLARRLIIKALKEKVE